MPETATVVPPLPLPTPAQIVKEVMADTLPAQDEDYSGNRLDKEKSDQLYEKFTRMRLRGVNNNALISRSLGIHPRTVASWTMKLEGDMRRLENTRSVLVERNLMIAKLDEAQQVYWQLATTEDVSTGLKISAIAHAVEAIMAQASLLGVVKQVIVNTNVIANIQHFHDSVQVSESKALAEGIKSLLAGGIAPVGDGAPAKA